MWTFFNILSLSLIKRALSLKSKEILFKQPWVYSHPLLHPDHRHLSNIDCLMAHTACLVCFISSSKKKKPWKTGASSRHITNLKQSILETFDIYDPDLHFNGQKTVLLLLLSLTDSGLNKCRMFYYY